MPDSDLPREFLRVIRNEDQIGAILRAHLLVENRLSELLNHRTNLNWADTYHRRLFGYRHKVEVAVAIDLVPKKLLDPLHKLGEIRNDFAHKLGYELTEAQQDEFLQCIPNVFRENAAQALASAARNLDNRTSEPGDRNVHHLSGLQGRRAVTFSFVAGLFALIFELQCLLDDLQQAEEVELHREFDEQDNNT